jgi:hypothetical protein
VQKVLEFQNYLAYYNHQVAKLQEFNELPYPALDQLTDLFDCLETHLQVTDAKTA